MMIPQVHCVDTRGGLVPDARCNILSRPDSEAYCSAGPCVTNTWLVSRWNVVRIYSQTVSSIFTFSLLVSVLPSAVQAWCIGELLAWGNVMRAPSLILRKTATHPSLAKESG